MMADVLVVDDLVVDVDCFFVSVFPVFSGGFLVLAIWCKAFLGLFLFSSLLQHASLREHLLY